LGIELKQAQGSIRFSTGRFTTLEEIDLAAKLIIKALQKKPISQNSVNETNLGET
jgi:cysteine sulfinate desulfinase/cysteine desulfurase-like protein